MSEMIDQKTKRALSDKYFLPRDFELVQPIYDLAFVLKINGSRKENFIPKYRVASLNMAAQNLDGYSNLVATWLGGDLTDDDLDYVPSARIRALLIAIKETGTIRELHEMLSPEAKGCLRLRSIRGLGGGILTEFLRGGPTPSHELLAAAARRCGLPQDEILSVYEGKSYGRWQAPHILPPLLRFLKRIEEISNKEIKWGIVGIANGISPIKDRFRVFMQSETDREARDILKGATQNDPFFIFEESSRSTFRILHQMGWDFEISPKTDLEDGKHLEELISALDPLAMDLPTSIKSDLHVHTTWSDGIATPTSMVQAARNLGLAYIAITEHSRSSKLQRGLTPSVWLRQAMSVSRLKRKGEVLHGMEVDILKGGDLDMPEGILSGMDFVIGSVHSNWGGSEESNTVRIIKAIESGYVDVIGHPTSALIGRPGEPSYVRNPLKIDWYRVFDCCSKWHVALEINCFPSRFDLSPELTRKAIEAGCWVALGTDAHSCFHLEVLKFGPAICEIAQAHRNTLNCRSFKEIQNWLRQARRVRSQRVRTKPNAKQAKLFATPASIPRNSSALVAQLNGPPEVPKGSVAIGIDLTDGKNRKTGVALLSGMNVETKSLRTDEDLLTYIKEVKPAIVSIDSPLGLPGGGKDIDPEAGIVRAAERDLSSVGISSYPALIDSMKGLTLRGIRLRGMIESLDDAPVVIESYPGAAQDILCIPRKQRGLNLLREGLKELGLRGPGLLTNSHDEMDAITSALVARFFEAGQYEAMGIESEARLIVPTGSILTFDTLPVICITGKTGSGKSVVSRYLALYYGFKWVKTRDIILNLIIDDFEGISSQKLNLTKDDHITEVHLREFGRIIMEQHGQLPLRKRLLEELLRHTCPVVVDSIRSLEDVDPFNIKKRAIYTWYVSCPDSIIRDRWVGRKNSKGDYPLSYETIDRNADTIMQHADIILKNDGTLENLHRIIDDVLFSQIVEVTSDK